MNNTLQQKYEPFLVRAKSLDPEYADKEKQTGGNLIVQSTRGQIFKLAPAKGEFLEPSKVGQQYNYLLHVQEEGEGGFKLLNIVSGQSSFASDQPAERVQGLYKK